MVRVTAAGLCHSDLHVQKGYMDLGHGRTPYICGASASLPMTFGHEIAGIVEAVGGDVTSVRCGQQVLVFPGSGVVDAKRVTKIVKVTARPCASLA